MTEHTEVVVYTQPNCGPCREVERYLDEAGVTFSERDVSRDADALAELIAQGFMSTPVTRIGDTWIAGYNRRQLEAATASLTSSI